MAEKRWKDNDPVGSLSAMDGYNIVIPVTEMDEAGENGEDKISNAGDLRDYFAQTCGKVTKVSFANVFYGNDTEGNEAFFDVAYARELLGISEDGGVNGLSAYQIAQANGFSGNEAAWLLSLKGAPGTDGTDGTNGTNGDNGLSAYDIAVDGGFVGNEAAWLASLHGNDGNDGTDGVDGTDGSTGKSAYELALDNGLDPGVTEAQWLESFGGLPPTLAWGMDDLASPPEVWLDADDPSLYTLTDFSRVIATIKSKFNDTTYPMTPNGLMLLKKSIPFNGRRAISFNGTSGAGKISITGTAGLNLGRNATAVTLILCGRFLTDSNTTTGGGVPLIYLGTPTADFVRASIARSSVQANILRRSARRNDGDSASGVDVGGNQGSTPFVAMVEFDYANGTVNFRIGGKEAESTTMLTAGSTSNTAALFNGFGTSSAGGTTTPWEMNCAGIKIGKYTLAEKQKIEGFMAWKLRMAAEILEDAAHPYRTTPPSP